MPQWLYQRFKTESPHITPDFSLRNSSRWQRALRIVCESGKFEEHVLRKFYSSVGRRNVNVASDNTVFESILMSLHYMESLGRMIENRADHYGHVRSAIIAWYYGIYYAAIAMLAASNGTVQRTHTGNAKSWGRQVLDNGLVAEPFSYRLSTLVKGQCDTELQAQRSGNTHHLNECPVDLETAVGGCISYLKGTADRERGIAEEAIKLEKDFRELGVANFRTRRAGMYRDSRLAGRTVNFLHQAFRYRGKANYRDAIFLAYGQRRSEWIDGLVNGLQVTLQSFVKMASFYCPRRVERGTWAAFKADLEGNARVEVPKWLG